MGQYHAPVNLDKAEALHAHRMGQGLKLMEWGSGGYGGPTTAMALLMAPGGRWHGDRLAVVGDYAEPGDLPEGAPFAADPSDAYATKEKEETTAEAKKLVGEAFGVRYDADDGYGDATFDRSRMADLVADTRDDLTFGPLYVVDLDGGQFLDPHAFGSGRNLAAIALRSCGVMLAATVLLAVSNGRGGGDLHSDDPLIGSWGAHRVVIGPRPDDGALDLSERVRDMLLAGDGDWLTTAGGWAGVGLVPAWLTEVPA